MSRRSRIRAPSWRVRPLTLVLTAALVLIVASLAVRLGRSRHAAPIPQVQVLNGSGVADLAQQVGTRLRQHGLDVVEIGNADAREYPETLVLLRRGHEGVARQVRDALGRGRVVVQRDQTLLVDVTVILGRDAAPGRAGH